MVVISKLAIALLSPLGFSLFGGVVALVLAWAGRKRTAFCIGALAVVWLWFWSLPVASFWVRGYLESQYPEVAVEMMPEAEAIVVLGGGVSPVARGDVYPNLEPAADRVWHGARLFHFGKAPLIVLSGGSGHQFSVSSGAEAMRRFMIDLGVVEEAIILEDRSRNTTQNAAYSADILAEKGIDRILLVTSALHMARAKALFEKRGLEVIAAATDYEVTERPVWRTWLPETSALDGSGRAIKEIVGRLVGR